MKKLLTIVLSIMMAMLCMLSTACGEEALDVAEEEFYATISEKAQEIKDIVFSGKMTYANSDGSNEYIINAGLSEGENDFSLALEMKDTYTTTKIGRSYESERNYYLYNGTVYGKYGSKNVMYPEMKYEYGVMKLSEATDTEGLAMQLATPAVDFVTKLLNGNKDLLNSLSKKTTEILFTAKQTEDGFTIAYDGDKLLAVHADLKNLKINEFVDKYYGEGSFDKLKTKTLELLDTKLGDIMTRIDKSTDNALTALLNEIYTRAGEGQTEIKTMIEAYKEKTLAQIIVEMSGEEMTDAKIISTVSGAFGVCETLSVYGVLEEYLGLSEKIYNQVDETLKEYAKAIQIELNLDNEAKPKNLIVKGNASINDVSVMLDFNLEFNKKFADFETKTTEIVQNSTALN